jgi:hypothetical protein
METVIDTKDECIQELFCRHGLLVSRRFESMLNNREQAEGKTLSDVEIKDLQIRFDAEIYRELLMKGGK